MEVHFTPEQEAQLAQIATKAGTDPEHLVKDAVLRLLQNKSSSRTPAPEGSCAPRPCLSRDARAAGDLDFESIPA